MSHGKKPNFGGANDAILAGIAIAFAAALLLPTTAVALDPPTPLNVLFVANGYYVQETHVEDHLLDLGYAVTKLKDYQIKGTTSLAPYDLIVLTEFAPSVGTAGINNIKNSGKPVLIVEYWDFNYSKKLGLTTSASCGYVGTDTVEAVRSGYDAFTSRVGVEALVYQPGYTVYGIDASKLTAGTTPLYWSSASFGEVAVLVHRGKKVAATGVYDTRKYTSDAWKMFDLLVEQVVPPRPRWQTMQDVAQAYVDSGMYSFLGQVEQDLARDPGSWTFDEVEREAWLLTTEWNLGEIWDHIYEHVCDIFELEPQFPQLHFSAYAHPERPHGLTPGFLDPNEPDEHEHWLLGRYWDPSNMVALPPHWGEVHTGTDLGMSVRHFGRTVFYMGDTWMDWNNDGVTTLGEAVFSRNDCPEPAWCDDMIVVSSDTLPDDGIDVVPVLDEDGRWIPLSIPGVHRETGTLMSGYWPGAGDIQYTVPTGAVAASIPLYLLLGQPQIIGGIRTVIVWYGTATNAGGDANNPSWIVNDSLPMNRPTSWAGCSFDGIHFRACYRDSTDSVVPFSIDEGAALWPPSTGDPARFVQVAADDLDWEDMDAICWSDPDSPLCLLDDPELSPFERGGLLLYGSGRPYHKSGLFMAFVERTDLGRVDSATGKPVVRYWSGTGWSGDEADAAPLTGAPPCDDTLTPYLCIPPDGNAVFGELSARLFRSPFFDNRFVLLSNHPPYANPIQSRTASFTEPWTVTGPSPTLSTGYGPYIIDRFSSFDQYTSTAEIWHVTSVWDGTEDTPYGVYSGYEKVVWP